MTWIADTLWDLLAAEPTDATVTLASSPVVVASSAPVKRVPPVQHRYDELVRDMKQRFGVRVRKWRSSTSGCAWKVFDTSGRSSSLIEAPYPRGPVSCAVFLHEIGHHAIGFGTYAPRCLEEYHAWRWALETMGERGFTITAAVERRRDEALRYAVEKARRRGLQRLPVELATYEQTAS